MTNRIYKTARIGDLISAAFDVAGRHSIDPLEVSRLATQVVVHMLRHARRTSIATRALERWESDGGSIPGPGAELSLA